MTNAAEFDKSLHSSDTTGPQPTTSIEDSIKTQDILVDTALTSPDYDPSEISSLSPVSAFFRQEYLQFPSSLRSSYPSTAVSGAEMQWSPIVSSSLAMPSFLAGSADEILPFSPKGTHELYDKQITDAMAENDQLDSLRPKDSSQSSIAVGMNQLTLQFPFSDGGVMKFVNPFDSEFGTHLSHDHHQHHQHHHDASQMHPTETFFQEVIMPSVTTSQAPHNLQTLLPYPSAGPSQSLSLQPESSSSRRSSKDEDSSSPKQDQQQKLPKIADKELPKEIDGIEVNPEWGLTKAGKARQRLPIACLTCRGKKIRCIRDSQSGGPCENCLKNVALRDSCRTEERPRPRRSSLPGKGQTSRIHKRRSSTQYNKSPPKLPTSAESSYSTDFDQDLNKDSALSSMDDIPSSTRSPIPEVTNNMSDLGMNHVVVEDTHPFLRKLHTSPVHLVSPSRERLEQMEFAKGTPQDLGSTNNAPNFEIFNESSFDGARLPVEDTIAGLSETLADPVFFQSITDSVNILQ